MRIQKVTSVDYLLMLAPKIKEFSDHLKSQHMSYEAICTYLAASIQGNRRIDGGPDRAEFWVALNEGKPRAFAHWFVRPIPHLGKVFMDAIYSWAKTPKLVDMLTDEFIEFGKRHRCPIYEVDCVNEKVFRVFQMYAKKKGYEVSQAESIHAIGRKKGE